MARVLASPIFRDDTISSFQPCTRLVAVVGGTVEFRSLANTAVRERQECTRCRDFGLLRQVLPAPPYLSQPEQHRALFSNKLFKSR